jgi:hypothetical protein
MVAHHPPGERLKYCWNARNIKPAASRLGQRRMSGPGRRHLCMKWMFTPAMLNALAQMMAEGNSLV